MITVQEKQQSDNVVENTPNVVENTPVLFAEHKGELVMKIYDTLRKEIEEWIREINVLFVYATLATGVVWGWVLSEQKTLENLVEQDHLLRWLLFVPTLLAGLFAVRSLAIRTMIQTASTHLAKIEKTCGLDGMLGWDIYWYELHKVRADKKTETNPRKIMALFPADLDGFLVWFWCGIVLVNFAAALLVFWTV